MEHYFHSDIDKKIRYVQFIAEFTLISAHKKTDYQMALSIIIDLLSSSEPMLSDSTSE